MLWDLFCRVVDNFGDVGVCWRLAADLGARGERVRLWLDDAAALDWLAPRGAPGVSVQRWCDAEVMAAPGDVVVEAFGCDPPAAFVARMAAAPTPPRWINLEYLSAERYVERSHGLRSPQTSGPGAGLAKRFFYPGFTPRTGGLLREPDLMAQRHAFGRDAWLAAKGWARLPGERVVMIFCYDNPALAPLLAALADAPTLLLLAPGAAQRQAAALPLPKGQRRIALPWLDQAGFDRLLWSADLNFVRGEDSFVRAQWAGAPFVWQIYPQHDGAHVAKLEAFLDTFVDAFADADVDTSAAAAAGLRALWLAWNGLAPWPAQWPSFESPASAWAAASQRWREALLAQNDLCSQLLRCVMEPG